MNLSMKYFPYIQRYPKYAKNIAILGIGSNLGNCLQILHNLFITLTNHRKIHIYSTSYIYKNVAFGYTKQPDFYNTSIILTTNMCVRSMFALIFYLERKFGRSRVRSFKNAPRSLDIDLIYFANMRICFKHLHLPHQDFHNRKSVLLPLRFQLGLNK
ncbi:2-amino-4-hydroxy-6-hydroxymethyldihydropteridine diphosphokinase [Helicobacter didelphidarum]|uniref:2-amino-4-hydroxy-6-hydroxymethyldihydropteridine pyrophosphokinase n=1 Tax=Helicobacter didelphidarum TaxID=2040648 RepID=A0A3D8IQV0_9HELI|nr:2-amino-4-hydroxy-6-hydroxymethyldihydropteridine diphosphokinase [Helicobacter didelphidarum]RDU67572.1 2-amino-4-hydroxy-6-hydroxymethyldihydropteridine diphosphokinase [Helicobacter didelphidarum]